MKLTPRTILIAGIPACLVAAWSGFLLGGGLRPADIGTGSTAAEMEHPPRVIQAASPSAQATRSREFSARFTGPSSATESVPENEPFYLTTSAKAAPGTDNLDKPAASAPAASPAIRRRRHGTSDEETPPHYPLVMLDLPPSVLGSQPGLTAAVANLREKFIAEIGGTQQNPADPAYLERWTQGVARSDDQLRAAIGWQAYNDLAAAASLAKMAAP